MGIEYEVNGRPRAEEVCALCVAVGWRNPAEHGLHHVQQVWNLAPCTVLARDGQRLIGMCRAIWDGGLTAEVANVVVHPDYQRQGVGRDLMRRLMAEIDKLPVWQIHLNCALGKERFYEQFGFQTRDTVTPMVIRRRPQENVLDCQEQSRA